jgi:hypothetical protein
MDIGKYEMDALSRLSEQAQGLGKIPFNFECCKNPAVATLTPTQNGRKHAGYRFKKKKPLPGQYPNNYSPYRLQSCQTSRSSIINLTQREIHDDVQTIQHRIAALHQSEYFEEAGVTAVSSYTSESSRVRPIRPMKRMDRPSRSRARDIAEPQSLEEERSQLRAAIRASMSASHFPGKLPLSAVQSSRGCRRAPWQDSQKAPPCHALAAANVACDPGDPSPRCLPCDTMKT